MNAFLKANINRRMTDGFAVGYNMVFPIILVGILGVLTKRSLNLEISSFQYYTIVMIPYCLLLSLVTAAYSGKEEAGHKVAERILASPIEIRTIVCSKVISNLLSFFLCTFLTYCMLAAFLHIGGFGTLPLLLLFYLSLSLLTSVLGTYIGLSMRNFLVVKNLISIPITLFALLGGTFYPIRTSNGLLMHLIEYSPVRLVNRGLFLLLYDHRIWPIVMISLVMILISVFMYVLTIRTFKKEEYLHGSMAGYEM